MLARSYGRDGTLSEGNAQRSRLTVRAQLTASSSAFAIAPMLAAGTSSIFFTSGACCRPCAAWKLVSAVRVPRANTQWLLAIPHLGPAAGWIARSCAATDRGVGPPCRGGVGAGWRWACEGGFQWPVWGVTILVREAVESRPSAAVGCAGGLRDPSWRRPSWSGSVALRARRCDQSSTTSTISSSCMRRWQSCPDWT